MFYGNILKIYPCDTGGALVCLMGHDLRTVNMTQPRFKVYCVLLTVFKFCTFVRGKLNRNYF